MSAHPYHAAIASSVEAGFAHRRKRRTHRVFADPISVVFPDLQWQSAGPPIV
jgi:hypothetical protein